MSEIRRKPELCKKVIGSLGFCALISFSFNTCDYHFSDYSRPCKTTPQSELDRIQEAIELKEDIEIPKNRHEYNLKLANSLGIHVVSLHQSESLDLVVEKVDKSTNFKEAMPNVDSYTEKHFGFRTQAASKHHDLPFEFKPLDNLDNYKQESAKKNIYNFLSSLSQIPTELIKNIDLNKIIFVKDFLHTKENVIGKDLNNGTLVLDIDNLGDDSLLNHELGHRFDALICGSKYGMLNDSQFASLQPDWLRQKERKDVYKISDQIEYNKFMIDSYGLKDDAEDKAMTYEAILEGDLPEQPQIRQKIILLAARLNEINDNSGYWFILKEH